MSSNIIKKDLNSLKIKPNLQNYEETYPTFQWKIPEFINAGVNSDIDPEKIAIYWVGANDDKKILKFKDIERLSNQFGNYLKSHRVQKGDRVFFFLSRIPEVYYGFIGSLKIGAIAGTLFPAFGTQALMDRLGNAKPKVLVTNKELYPRVEEIKEKLPFLETVLFVEDLEEQISKEPEELEIEDTKAEDPAYMLFTSATGNTPVCGIVTPHKAVIQQKETARWVLDLHNDDIYWCTADYGWVTGMVYGILAPYNLGITCVVDEGRFDPERWFKIIEEYKVNVMYTAPTALRMLAKEETINHDFSSLRHLCSVGEALTPASISWAQKTFKMPIHDTWWQTETGAMMITNYASVDIKPGSMGKPIPGVHPLIVDDEGKEMAVGEEGDLAFIPDYPSKMIDVWENKARYDSYFKNNLYYSGDRAKKDEDGYYWFIGRADDVIKTSGERVGPFEVESALATHPAVLESGVIGKPDPLRGEIIKAFIVLRPSYSPSEALKEEIQAYSKKTLAGHAYPREIEFIDKLPKNRSGKIVRRILKARELGLPEGETSTLDND